MGINIGQVDPQAMQKLLFGGPQSLLTAPPDAQQPTPQAPAPGQAPQPGDVAKAMSPQAAPADPTKPQSLAEFGAANPDATKAYMPTRPVGDFDKLAEGTPGADSWGNRHNVLRRLFGTLAAGAAEFGGDLNHHPGQGAQFVDRWAGQDQAQKQFDNPANQEKMKAGALSQAYQTYLGQQEKAVQASKDRYLAPRSGGVFDVTKGGYAPGAEPAEKPEAPHTVETGNGVLQWNPQTSRYDIPVGPGKAAPKPDSPEQQFIDEYQAKHKGSSVGDAVKAYGAATQKPEREPKQMIVGPDGTVIELHPGMKVPAGSKTAAKYGEPSADEQRRADLAGNLNENFNQLEDIVNRRPELFGPLAGRWTDLKGKFGSDDPDIGALQTLEHQIGMAQISAHGMRSAHGIEGASQSIMNGLHSGPKAIHAAIDTARKSVQTFQNDVAVAKGQQPAGKPTSKGAPQSKGAPPQGATHVVPGPDGQNHYTNAAGTVDLGIAP